MTGTTLRRDRWTLRSRSTRLAGSAMLLAGSLLAAPLLADPAVPVERLNLICQEEPMRAVSFGEPGEVSYGEQPPRESEPVTLTLTKTAPGEDFQFDYATIDASAPDLSATDAIWIKGKQIEAQHGRFKINLNNLVMTLTETDPDGSARFRRFQCEKRLSAEGPSGND